MMKGAIFILCMIISISGFAQAESTDLNDQFFSEKIEFFYINSDPIEVTQVIKEMAEANVLQNFFYFFVALAKEHPKEIMEWFSNAQVNVEKHSDLIHALHCGGLKGEAICLAQRANWPINKIFPLGQDIPSFLSRSVDFPGYISCMCNHFFVTGDVKYVRRIIDALELGPLVINDPNALNELIEESQQAIRCFIFKHDKVYRLCLKEAKSRKGDVALFLNHLLGDLHQAYKNVFPTQQEGLFNAFVLVTEDLHFEEQWENLPAMATPVCKHIDVMAYPSKNTFIQVFLMFNGIELDQNLNGRITYDLEIIDPRGNKMGEFFDLEGINQKVASRFWVQKADQSIAFEFCPGLQGNDKNVEKHAACPGSYVIKATLKDHVSGQRLQVESTLEVLPKSSL